MVLELEQVGTRLFVDSNPLPMAKFNKGTNTKPSVLIYSEEPIARRIIFFLKVWGLKIFITVSFAVIRWFRPLPRELRPTIIKAFPCRPNIRNRIFIPRGYNGGLLPLYLNIHGGGFTFLDAEFDDEFCGRLANKFKVLVVSIDYGTAPRNRFPGPVNDVIAVSLASIEDDNLPVDKSHVVIGGFSAGGNLALSASQTEVLRDRIHGVVSWYPVTDLSLTPAEKQSTRSYRHARDLDDLKDWGPVLNWSYVPPGTNLRGSSLSVRYAKAERLPKWIHIVGAQYDMLMNEARDTIFDLARLSVEERNKNLEGFERGTYKWTFVKDVRHAFTHDLMDSKNAELEEFRKRQYADTLDQVGQWLFSGPFAVQDK